MYRLFVKRLLDIVLSLFGMVLFCWLFAIVAVLVRVKLGSPVLFTQKRSGRIDPKTGREKIFKLYKFRSMTYARDENGNLLPDDARLTKFGKTLRSTSLDTCDIIGQTTKSIENKGFREVSPILFFRGCNLFSNAMIA